MITRWATEDERRRFGIPGWWGHEHDVLVAMEPDVSDCLGYAYFSREKGRVERMEIYDGRFDAQVREVLQHAVEEQLQAR